MPADRPVVLLARHGETEWNRAARMQGQVDVPLAPRGEAQARALAARLAREGVGGIVTSDLARARATAQAVAEATGLPPALEPRLREQRLGAWEGLTFAQARLADPELAARFAARDPDARPPGGETRAELQRRAWEALEEHAASGRAGPLLVVAHGGVIQSILYRVLGLPIPVPRRFLLPNVALTTLVPRADAWFVRTLSDTTHVAGTDADNFPFE